MSATIALHLDSAVQHLVIDPSAEPLEFRACAACGVIQNREAMSQCSCGQFECRQHTCPCTPAEVWKAA